MNTWIFIGVLIFNVGVFVATHFNHFRHTKDAIKDINKKIDQLFSKVNTNATNIAKIQGKLNNKG